MIEDLDPSEKKEERLNEKTAFKTIFEMHYAEIFHHLYKIVGSTQEAEDLTQMVFLRLHHHLDIVEPPKTKNWLYRVATNLGLNSIRDRKRRQKWINRASNQQDVLREDRQQPEEEMLLRSERKRVRIALKMLPARDAKMLYLYYAGLKSYKELAEEFGVQPSSIGTLLSRAKKAFKMVYHGME